MIDVKPERAVLVALARNQVDQRGTVQGNGLKHGLLARWVRELHPHVQPGDDLVAHGGIRASLDFGDQSLAGAWIVSPVKVWRKDHPLLGEVALQHRVDWQVEQRIGVGQFHTQSFEVVVMGLGTGLHAVQASATGY